MAEVTEYNLHMAEHHLQAYQYFSRQLELAFEIRDNRRERVYLRDPTAVFVTPPEFWQEVHRLRNLMYQHKRAYIRWFRKVEIID